MRRTSHSAFRFVAVPGDLAIAAGALGVAFWLRTRVHIPGTEMLLPLENVRFTPGNVFLVGAAQVVSLSLFGLYGARERFRDPLGRLLIPALFFQLLALSAVFFLAFAQAYAFPRSVLVLYLIVNGVALAVWRLLLERLFPQRRRRALIVGSGPAAALIAEAIRRHPWTGVDLVGLVADGESPLPDLERVAPISGLAEATARLGVDEVILTPDAPNWRDRIGNAIPADSGIDLLVWPSPFETMIGRLRFRIVGDLPLLEARVHSLEGIPAALKRTFDVAASAILLLALLPLLAIGALAIAATSQGGAFYRQVRTGKDGRRFSLWKLRTMRAGAETETGAVLSSPGDPRVTGVGRAFRALRIDEIPQLWNVFVGDMSLVGPRPERPEFTDRFERTVAGYPLRHSVRPGVTGLAQISGDYATEPEIKLRYDLAYLNNWSFGLDLAILLRTLPVVLTRRGI
ncbi:MAG: sugar transferase [Acidobacteriota bacterium]|nr:sugar transferase [Acidobacteriota bacterium]